MFSFLAAPKERILAILSRKNKSAATDDRSSGCPPRSPRRSVIDINCWSTSICGESQLNFITVAVPGQKRISISINCVPESDRRWQRSRGRVNTTMCTTSASMVQYRPRDSMTLLRVRMASSFIVSAYFDLLTHENREQLSCATNTCESVRHVFKVQGFLYALRVDLSGRLVWRLLDILRPAALRRRQG